MAILMSVTANCQSSGAGFDPENYDFSNEAQEQAIDALDLERIIAVQARTSKSAIKSGSGMRKQAACISAAENEGRSEQVKIAKAESAGGAAMTESSGTVTGLATIKCRSTKNNFEECECHIGVSK